MARYKVTGVPLGAPEPVLGYLPVGATFEANVSAEDEKRLVMAGAIVRLGAKSKAAEPEPEPEPKPEPEPAPAPAPEPERVRETLVERDTGIRSATKVTSAPEDRSSRRGR